MMAASFRYVAALARGEYLRTHFKNAREVAAALQGALSCSIERLNWMSKSLVLDRLEAD